MQVVVDSLLVQYERSGAGPVVVLLHGWGDSRATYAALAQELCRRYTVVSLDLPGFGGSQAPQGVWGLDEYAAFVEHFLGKLNVANIYAIVGHSNGAALTIRGLAKSVLVASKVVLIGAAGIRTTQTGKRLAVKAVAKIGKIATFWLPVRYRRKLQKMLYGAAGSDMFVAPNLQETFKKTVRQDVQSDAATIVAPTLLIYGADDRATPPSYGETYSGLIKNSRLEVLQQAGHFVHQDQSVLVNQLIMEFLS